MFAPACPSQLPVTVQLILTSEPQLRGKNAIVIGQREMLIPEVLILPGAPIPFTNDHTGMQAVKLLQTVGEVQPLSLIIEVDVLIRHDVQWAM